MELTTKRKGNLTELQCLAAFMSQNCSVSIPYGDNDKYDFITDIDGKLYKIQVKTASLKKDTEGAINFSCRSTHLNCKGVSNIKYSADDIDFFATFWDNQCYLIPINECSTQKTLRFTPPKSGQNKNISFATDYEIEKQIAKIRKEVSN